MSNQELLAILKEMRETVAEDRRKPLVDCPLCGIILEVRSDGTRNCVMGHFRTTKTTQEP